MHYSIDGLTKLYCHEVFRGLYKGFVPGLWGTSHGTIQFVIEEFKRSILTTNLFLLMQSWQVDIYSDYVNIDAFYPLTYVKNTFVELYYCLKYNQESSWLASTNITKNYIVNWLEL